MAGLRYACTKIEVLPELNKVQLHGLRASIVCRLHFNRTETWTDSTQSKMKPPGVTTFSRRERNSNFV